MIDNNNNNIPVLCIITILLTVGSIGPTHGYPGVADEVRNLPGLDFPINYRHYSGYLNSTEDRYLHYWFFESQRSPATDPLVLWLNGGPGCSSVLGALTEQGPIHVNRNNSRQLYANPYSWNRETNILFLESPAGVGFSYKLDGQYATDDDTVAKANYQALKSFYKKFPQFLANDFYVTGESYAGVYVPTLAVEIVRGLPDQAIPLKGLAIGNGYLEQSLLGNSLIYFGYYHGLYDTSVWLKLLANCCPSSVNTLTNSSLTLEAAAVLMASAAAATANNNNNNNRCDFVNNPDTGCRQAVNQAVGFIREPGLNIYNLYADCEGQRQSTGAGVGGNSDGRRRYNLSAKYSREMFDRKLMLKTVTVQPLNGSSSNSNSQQQLWDQLRDTPPCVDTGYVEEWINQPLVRHSLHIPDDRRDRWTCCSLAVETGYRNIYKSMKPQFRELLASSSSSGRPSLKILVYNGDVDMACNFLGDEWFVEDMGRSLTQSYNIWHYNHQIAGYYKVYDRLAFVTVRGSGHMVPTDRSGAALKMFSAFINSEATNITIS
ncbi:lysosomal protective protein-like [Oppia nitens]|uniref:lysosomal protective protein-like n=1 Tax=Oppia nitens TaxID=1686743 RepID=UPI0023DC55D4|nr:lysosomal protective protein-like [Oppia nitens]